MQLINSKILVTKQHSGIIVLMLSYLLPIRWQCHTVVSENVTPLYLITLSNIYLTTPTDTTIVHNIDHPGRIGATLYTATLEWKP